MLFDNILIKLNKMVDSRHVPRNFFRVEMPKNIFGKKYQNLKKEIYLLI